MSFIRKAAMVAIVAVTMGATVSAQTFTKGDNLFSVGLGLGGNTYSGSDYTSKTPPIGLYYENCVKDNLFDEKSSLGIGGMFAYTSAKWETAIPIIGGTYGWKHTSMIIGVRGALHYQFIDKLDTYGGLTLGYNIHSSSAIGDASKYGTPSSFGGFDWDLFIGGRYYFTDNIGAFLDLGYGIAVANVGVTFKF